MICQASLLVNPFVGRVIQRRDRHTLYNVVNIVLGKSTDRPGGTRALVRWTFVLYRIIRKNFDVPRCVPSPNHCLIEKKVNLPYTKKTESTFFANIRVCCWTFLCPQTRLGQSVEPQTMRCTRSSIFLISHSGAGR